MSNSSPGHRRYEVLLPKQFNDGTPVPDSFIADTVLELRDRFGAVSAETQTIQGIWIHGGKSFRDDLMRLFVDVPDDEDSHRFFVELKERLKQKFDQLEMWVVSYPIRVE